MPGPFPGMDPWLEAPADFPDLHDRLIVHLSEALTAGLPAGYFARIGTRVWVDDAATREPDVMVATRRRPPAALTGGAAAVAELPGLVDMGAEPVAEPWQQPYLDIYTTQGRRLVTLVEVLSPSNKRPGAGRESYLEKQQECRLGGIHVVEIDLLRAGTHATCTPRGRLERAAGPFDYHVSVRRAGDRPDLFAAPIRLADRLPAFAVPLDPGVPPVMVDLQVAFDRCYDGGRYGNWVEYGHPPDPPLTPEQAAWATDRLRAAGLLPA